MGLELAGVYAHSPVPDRYLLDSFDELLERSDLVVEAASQEAVSSYGPAVVDARADLLVVAWARCARTRCSSPCDRDTDGSW